MKPATPRKRAAPKEPGARELGVDSGPPPQLGPEPSPAGDDDVVIDDRPPLEPPTALETLEAWETETVGMMLSALLLLFHFTLGRGGPPDAYVPDESELGGMARPATRMLNRSERARRLAKAGDGVAFATAFGGFVATETRAVAEFRATAAEQAPELDLAAVAGVREAGAEETQGPVRRWRPPVVPPEEPPA